MKYVEFFFLFNFLDRNILFFFFYDINEELIFVFKRFIFIVREYCDMILLLSFNFIDSIYFFCGKLGFISKVKFFLIIILI